MTVPGERHVHREASPFQVQDVIMWAGQGAAGLQQGQCLAHDCAGWERHLHREALSLQVQDVIMWAAQCAAGLQ